MAGHPKLPYVYSRDLTTTYTANVANQVRMTAWGLHVRVHVHVQGQTPAGTYKSCMSQAHIMCGVQCIIAPPSTHSLSLSLPLSLPPSPSTTLT